MPSQDVSIARYFADLPDPRIDRTKKHQLGDILVIALCAVICGADSWEEVEAFGEAKEGWLKRHLPLPNGIPSHDTFGRVFARLGPQKFGECVAGWMAGVCEAAGLRHIAIDGKAVRAAPGNTFSGCLHLVGARAAEIVEDRAKIEIGAVNWDVGTDVNRDGDTLKVGIASENVDDLFAGVGRKLNSELHKEWLKRRVNTDKVKLELFALCINPDVIAKLESRANELVQEWVKKHKKAMGQQDESSQTGYTEVMNLTEKAELREIQYPATIRGKVSEQLLKKHVYVMDTSLFPGDLNGPEERIIGGELDKKEAVAWLRNMDRKEWALTIPYEVDGEERPMYPDFLVVRRANNELVVDIIDPHSIGLADAPAKAAGMAKFAAQHADAFGRIDLILLDGAKEKRLDLTNESVRNKVRAVNTIEFLRSLMD